jgi:hypothetical protein
LINQRHYRLLYAFLRISTSKYDAVSTHSNYLETRINSHLGDTK